MEEIKVGDYIRTKQWGIAKVAKIDEKGKCTHIKNKNNRITHYFEQIGRTSQNIIDLIECGDYVNGYKVRCTKYEYFGHFFIDLEEDVNAGSGYGYQLHEKDIKSIVTHEQFNSIKYEVI